jgi:hypothetical protein
MLFQRRDAAFVHPDAVIFPSQPERGPVVVRIFRRRKLQKGQILALDLAGSG